MSTSENDWSGALGDSVPPRIEDWDAGCVFRSKPITDSGRNRSPLHRSCGCRCTRRPSTVAGAVALAVLVGRRSPAADELNWTRQRALHLVGGGGAFQ